MDDLAGLRARIDEYDDRLVEVLSARLAVCDEVAAWKAANGVALMQPDRIREVEARGAERAAERGLAPAFVRELYALIIAEACRREEAIIGARASQ